MATLSIEEFNSLGEIIKKFDVRGTIYYIKLFGKGRINKTYLITLKCDNVLNQYLLQSINTEVFKDPDGLMRNIVSVTNYMKSKGANTLQYIRCLVDGKDDCYVYTDENGKAWRLYNYVDAEVYETIYLPEHAYALGKAIAEFYAALDGYETNKLIDTIPDFHNTPKRAVALLRANARCNVRGDTERINNSKEYIDFVLSCEERLSVLTSALADGSLRCRVVHNDPKLNNVLFNKQDGSPKCMIDLDTIMEGTSLYDVGDALRYIANAASEDDKTPERVEFKDDIFARFIDGYLSGMAGKLDDKEIELIPESIWVMSMELGIRFLTDHLNGNKYFGCDYDGQNLERAIIQFEFAKKVDEKIQSGKLAEIIDVMKK